MAEKQKSKVAADIKKNRLYITIPSTANKTELSKVYTDVRFCVADLKPGFDVVTDLSQCTIGHLNGLGVYKKITDYLVLNKVGRVVRIVGEMSVVLKQLLAFSSKFQCYKPVYVTSLQEAEAEFLQPIKPEALRFQIIQRQIEYSVEHKHAHGYLVDISTSGCAVQSVSAVQGAAIELSKDQEITMNIPLFREEDTLSSFPVSAKVVWVADNQFAVMFLGLDQERKEELYQCLVHEVQRENV
jgi:hypothetical protein